MVCCRFMAAVSGVVENDDDVDIRDEFDIVEN
jgi:hypothetical protein